MTISEKQKKYRSENWDRIRAIERKSHQKHILKREAYRKAMWEKRGDELRAYYRQYFRKNKERRKAASRRYYAKNKELIKADGRRRYRDTIPYQRVRSTTYYHNNKQRKYLTQKLCREKNKDKYNASRNKWKRYQYKTNPVYKIISSCRSKIHIALKRQSAIKSKRTIQLLGCSADFFKTFLQNQFTGNMSWENYGKYWNIDHVIPVSSFDLTVPENQKKAFHYSNCRPMLASHNFSKFNKNPGPHQPFLL